MARFPAAPAREQLADPVLGEHGRDRARPPEQVTAHVGVGLGRTLRPPRESARPPLVRVDDDHRASRVVAYAIGHVAEQELPATAHPEVPDHQDVDTCLLGRSNDRHRGVHVDHDPGPATGSRERLSEPGELVRRGGGSRRLGDAGLRAGFVLRDDDLEEVQLGPEALRHLRGPVDRPRRTLGPVRRHHDALNHASPPGPGMGRPQPSTWEWRRPEPCSSATFLPRQLA